MYSALTESALKKNKDITTLSDQDVRTVEEVIEVLKPLKILTTLMSTESSPSVLMILPLKTTVLNSMEHKEEDSDFFHECTALDPRFKALPHVDDACLDRIYNSLITEIVTMEDEQVFIFLRIKCLHCLI